MPKRSRTPPRPEVSQASGRLGAFLSRRPADDPVVIEARKQLDEVNAKVKRDRAIDTLVTEWPKLSPEQIARVVGLLRSGREPP